MLTCALHTRLLTPPARLRLPPSPPSLLRPCCHHAPSAPRPTS